ncbi:MAG TPA: hypothetical protein VFJ72_14405 [Rubrobacteraceae bacterium]|nr:hypothetical protein [Rubrobacteraceae bacterium]
MVRGLILLAVGVVPAFFLVFVTLFGDSSGLGDYALAYGMTFFAYLLVAFVAGFVWDEGRPVYVLWLVAPAVIVIVWYVTQEPQVTVLGIGSLAIALVGTLLGVFVGTRTRSRARSS